MDYNAQQYGRDIRQTQPASYAADVTPEYEETGGGKEMTRTIILVLGIVAVLALGYFQSERFRKNLAIDGCFQAGRVQLTQNNTPVSIPEEYWYDLCMERKGFK